MSVLVGTYTGYLSSSHEVIFEAVAVVHSFQGRVDFLIPVIQNEPF